MPPSRTPRRLALLVAGAALVAAASAPGASAAMQRYASPNGSGTLCSSGTPCLLTTAVQGSSLGDEIILKPGDYSLTATLADAHQITIHGIAGQARPRLIFTGAGQEGLRLTHGSTLRYAEVDQNAQIDASAVFASGSSTIDQVIARASCVDATVYVQNATIRNSIAVANGTGGWAVETSTSGGSNTSSYRHLTAIANGSGGVGIKVRAGFPTGKSTVDASNLIARGGGGGASLSVSTDGTGAQATLNIDHSNFGANGTAGSFAAIVKGAGNQSALPAFARAATGDYHQAPGSVTIGAGVDDPFSGSLDVDGQARAIGTTDIGADELVPAPVAVTGSATAVTEQSAALSGSANPQGTATAFHFEYGPTAAYGASSPTAGAGSGSGAVGVAANVAGLTPGTTYHFRLVASNAGGVSAGEDRTFTTAAPAGSTPTGSTPTGSIPTGSTSTGSTSTTPAAAFAGVRLVSTKLTFSRRIVTVTLRCPAATIGACSGRTKLTARRARLGRAAFSIAPGKRARVKVRVTRAGRRMLRRVVKLAAKNTNAAHDQAG